MSRVPNPWRPGSGTAIRIIGKASTISAQLARIQALGMVPSGPKIIVRKEAAHEVDCNPSSSAQRGGRSLRLAADHGRLL